MWGATMASLCPQTSAMMTIFVLTRPAARFVLPLASHLPLLPERADKYAIIRSMYGFSREHEDGTHMLLTGHDNTAPGSRRHVSRRDWPCYASGLDYITMRIL